MSTSSQHFAGARAFAALCVLAAPVLAGDPPALRKVALTGDAAPGTPAGVSFAQFGGIPGIGDDFPPALDASGSMVFHALLQGIGITGPGIFDGNALGIWKEVQGRLRFVARQDEPAPGTEPGVVFMGFPTPLSSTAPALAAGAAAFVGGLRGPGIDMQTFTNASGIWSEAPGALTLFMRTGEEAPGLPDGHVYRVPGIPRVAPDGRIAFEAIFRAPGDSATLIVPSQEGIWSDRSGTLLALVLGGAPAPGAEAGVVFGEGAPFAVGGAFRAWAHDEALGIALLGNLTGPGIHERNDEGVWSEGPGGLTLIAREGEPAPGIGGGVVFGAPNGVDAFSDTVALRRAPGGAVLFGARLSGPNVPFQRSLWTDRSGALELVVRSAEPLPGAVPGDAAPGLPAGWTFSGLRFADLDASGTIAFAGRATPVPDPAAQLEGLWWEGYGALALLALQGTGAPDAGAGVTFAGFQPFLRFAADGQILFFARLDGTGVDVSNDRALYASGPRGAPRLLLRTGAAIDVHGDGSALRTLARILPGFPSASGDLPLELGFTDGSSGLFTLRLSSAERPPFDAYCFGDGSGTACPCANEGSPGHGCANGTGEGALLGASGSASFSADDLTLSASLLPPGVPGIFFAGSARVNGGQGEPLFDGLRCAGGTVLRGPVFFASDLGRADLTGPIAAMAAGEGQVFQPGHTTHFQAWYRDPAASPCGALANLSNGLSVAYGP